MASIFFFFVMLQNGKNSAPKNIYKKIIYKIKLNLK
jgi:hypothetical protein